MNRIPLGLNQVKRMGADRDFFRIGDVYLMHITNKELLQEAKTTEYVYGMCNDIFYTTNDTNDPTHMGFCFFIFSKDDSHIYDLTFHIDRIVNGDVEFIKRFSNSTIKTEIPDWWYDENKK